MTRRAHCDDTAVRTAFGRTRIGPLNLQGIFNRQPVRFRGTGPAAGNALFDHLHIGAIT